MTQRLTTLIKHYSARSFVYINSAREGSTCIRFAADEVQ